MKTLIISAGGNGTRMQPLLTEKMSVLPKHLLPLPGNNTLINNIITNAQAFFNKIIISANRDNRKIIEKHVVSHKNVEVVVDQICNGPLGPMIRELSHSDTTIFGCAGDFYCDFNWDEFHSFHKKHNLPLSILVSRSIIVSEGARFSLKGNVVVDWKRVGLSSVTDLINMGAYIVEPNPDVVGKVLSLERYKEDNFFDKFIPLKMISGYDPGGIGFNVNTPAVYDELCKHLNGCQ